MLLGVKFYGPNAEGIPERWPEDVRELRDSSAKPPPGYDVMSPDEYEALRRKLQPEYDLYQGKLLFEEARARALSSLVDSCETYIGSHYSTAQRSTLLALMTEAIYLGFSDRAKYILAAVQWIKTLLGEYFECREKLKAASTTDDLNAIRMDFLSYDSQDPRVTIEKAMGMES